MKTLNQFEQGPPIKIETGPYGHLVQHDKKLLESIPYLKPEITGNCWAASMSMAVAALTGRESSELFTEVARVTYDYYPNNYDYIVGKLKEKHGPSGVIPRMFEEKIGLVNSETGGLGTFYPGAFPKQTANLLNFLMEEQLGISNVKLSITQEST